MGFKNGSSTDCNNTNGEDMIQCWEKIAYSIDDIILSNRGFSDIEHFYAGYSVGLALSLKIETGMISTSVLSTLHITMNPNMNYYLVITDSKLQATSNNLDLVPRTVIILEKNAGIANFVLKGNIFFHFYLIYLFCVVLKKSFIRQAIQHNKLSLAERPCQTSPEYNFTHCFHTHVIKNIGCQPHWTLVSVEGVPDCHNHTTLQKYTDVLWNISYNMNTDEVFQATNCLRPCTYMEYTVSVQSKA